MRQIIQSKPTERSLRQAAFQDAMGQAVQYGSNVFDTAQRAKTMREQALQREQAQNMQDIMNAQKLQVQTGQEVSPEDFAMARQSGSLTQPTGMSRLGQAFGVQADMAAQERARAEKVRQQEDEMRAAKLAQMGQPFEQSREAQKMRYAQSLKGEKPKEYKQNQNLAAGFYKRGVLAEQNLSQLPPDVGTGSLAGMYDVDFPFSETNIIPEAAKSEERKLFENARENFVSAVLRKESGAAISPAEFEKEAFKYFPQPGDTLAVRNQKAVLRQQALENLKAEAAGAEGTIATASLQNRPQEGESRQLLGVNQSQMQQYDPTRPITEAIVPTANAAGGNPLSGAPTDALAQRRQLLLQKAGGQ